MSKRFIDVAAGLILKPDGQLLLAQRPGDKPWSGWWELPGGKIESGETPGHALARELNEELGITVTQATPWVTYTHEYPETIVRLAFHRVTGWTGEPSGCEGQAIAWTDPFGTPGVSPLLPATEPPLRWLRLPDRYLLTSIRRLEHLNAFKTHLSAAIDDGVRMIQFREPEWAQDTDDQARDQLHQAFQQVLELCRARGAYCLVNSIHPKEWAAQADGIHYRASDAIALKKQGSALHPVADIASTETLPGALRGSWYVGMSVHTEQDLEVARQIHADFAVLGHVLETPSHPGIPGIGWDRFSQLNWLAGLPVYAIGGQSAATADIARQHGAHGIAGIRFVA